MLGRAPRSLAAMPIRIVEPAGQIELRSSHDARALERQASAAA